MSVDYSRLAADYDAVRGSEDIDRAFWFAGLVDLGRMRKGERFLDLGAGTGRFARFAAELGPAVAVDRSVDMLTQAKGKGPFERVRADAHRLPFRRDAFDAALLVMVVHQLADLRAALREVARVARRAVVATSDMGQRRLGHLEEAFPSLLGIDRVRFPPIDELVAALAAAGYRSVNVETRRLRRVIPVERELERVRRKYISTFDLLPPGEFQTGLTFLERELPRRHPNGVPLDGTFTFVGASR